MDYQKSISISGDIEKAAGTIEQVFTQQAYKIISRDQSTVELEQGVMPMSNNNNPLLAVSKIRITKEANAIRIQAELNGYNTIYKIIGIMLVGMAALFLVLFGFVIKKPDAGVFQRFIIPLLPLAPWPILLPLMKQFMKKRGTKALDILTDNIAMSEGS